MKKKAIIIALTILFLLSSCKPTPDTPPVIGKDQGDMIKAAQATAEADGQNADEPALTPEYPERFIASLTSPGGKLCIEADAELIVPKKALSVWRHDLKPSLYRGGGQAAGRGVVRKGLSGYNRVA